MVLARLAGGRFGAGEDLNSLTLPLIHPQLGEDFFNIPWGHIKLIIDKCCRDSFYGDQQAAP